MFYIGVLSIFLLFPLQIFLQFLLIMFKFFSQMSTSLEPYIGDGDGASRSTGNLSSTSWHTYPLNGNLVSLQGIFISLSTSNIIEYNRVFELLF